MLGTGANLLDVFARLRLPSWFVDIPFSSLAKCLSCSMCCFQVFPLLVRISYVLFLRTRTTTPLWPFPDVPVVFCPDLVVPMYVSFFKVSRDVPLRLFSSHKIGYWWFKKVESCAKLFFCHSFGWCCASSHARGCPVCHQEVMACLFHSQPRFQAAWTNFLNVPRRFLLHRSLRDSSGMRMTAALRFFSWNLRIRLIGLSGYCLSESFQAVHILQSEFKTLLWWLPMSSRLWALPRAISSRHYWSATNFFVQKVLRTPHAGVAIFWGILTGA